MQLAESRISIFRNDERTKLVLPVKRNVLALSVYTVLVLVWVIMTGLFIYSVFQPPVAIRSETISSGYRLGWRVLLIVWLIFWVRFIGRYLLHWWQFHLANRELLFFEKDVFIIRRPVSIFGVTDTYDMQHMRPFYRNDRYGCMAFQYGGVQHHIFGLGLTDGETQSLLQYHPPCYGYSHQE